MKAIVIRSTGPSAAEAWKLVDRKEPVPGHGQVLIRTRAASLNYRDVMIARGFYGTPLGSDVVPLSDGAGEVVAVGPGVTRFAVGDRVTSSYNPTWVSGPMRPEYADHQLGTLSNDGWLAERVVLPESGLVRVPDGLSFEQAATLPCAGVTAWHALYGDTHPLLPGETLLVQGTGGVSIFAAQLALAGGSRVLATTSSPEKAARLERLGVSEVIDYRKHPAWHEEVLRLTDGKGVDRVLEVGGAGTLASSFAAVQYGGSIRLVGLLTGTTTTVDPLPVLFKALRLEGVMVGSLDHFHAMNRAIERHRIAPVIDEERFGLENASAAIAKMEAGKHFGKIVISVS